MAAALTGVQRSQPTLATAPVSDADWAADDAGFRAMAFASVPPNQAASPRSCSERETVLRAIGTSCVLGNRWTTRRRAQQTLARTERVLSYDQQGETHSHPGGT